LLLKSKGITPVADSIYLFNLCPEDAFQQYICGFTVALVQRFIRRKICVAKVYQKLQCRNLADVISLNEGVFIFFLGNFCKFTFSFKWTGVSPIGMKPKLTVWLFAFKQ